MSKIYPKCTICNGVPSGGLYDGIRLAGRFICSHCERDIVTADMRSSRYEENLENVKRLLYGKSSAIPEKALR